MRTAVPVLRSRSFLRSPRRHARTAPAIIHGVSGLPCSAALDRLERMDARIYPIRRELSLVFGIVEETKRTQDTAMLVTAIDAMQDALSRTLDLVEELEDEAHYPGRYVRRGRMSAVQHV